MKSTIKWNVQWCEVYWVSTLKHQKRILQKLFCVCMYTIYITKNVMKGKDHCSVMFCCQYCSSIQVRMQCCFLVLLWCKFVHFKKKQFQLFLGSLQIDILLYCCKDCHRFFVCWFTPYYINRINYFIDAILNPGALWSIWSKKHSLAKKLW